MLALSSKTPSPFLPRDQEEAAEPAPKKTEKASTVAPVVTIDFNGLKQRVIPIPLPGNNYGKARIVNGRIIVQSAGSLLAYDLHSRTSVVLQGGVGNFWVSADNKHLLIQSGNNLQVVSSATGPFNSSTGLVPMAGLQLKITPKQEWKQIFNEAWRIARDFFYDPAMHGLNWNAVYKKYNAQLAGVEDRSELNYILGNMIAELNVGHAFVGGGDDGIVGPSMPMGFLGANLAPVPGKNAFKIVTLLHGDGFNLSNRSPLLQPGLNVQQGDYIVAVNERPVQADRDIQAMLIGTAGHTIALAVNTIPTLAGARTIYIKPLNQYQDSMARYSHWVNQRRRYVRKAGGGKIAYLHIPDMETRGMEEFNKRYFAVNQNHQAIIYDVRSNGGGYISGTLLVQMAFKPFSWFKPRFGASWTRYDFGFGGDAACLSNATSSSDAEEFSDAFQRLHLGPVIGQRTWGGEVGSGGGYHLIDGGTIFISNYGEWVAGKNGKTHWVIEGHGVRPNINVPLDPAARLAGLDPTLEAAVNYLKNELAKHPIPHYSHPPFPVMTNSPLAKK